RAPPASERLRHGRLRIEERRLRLAAGHIVKLSLEYLKSQFRGRVRPSAALHEKERPPSSGSRRMAFRLTPPAGGAKNRPFFTSHQGGTAWRGVFQGRTLTPARAV